MRYLAAMVLVVLLAAVLPLSPALSQVARPPDSQIDSAPRVLPNAEPGQVLLFRLTGDGSCRQNCTLWGDGIYTDDSFLAVAAVHAGVVAHGQTTVVAVEVLPGQSVYAGAVRHDVTSRGYGNWRRSFRFLDVQSEPRKDTLEDPTELAHAGGVHIPALLDAPRDLTRVPGVPGDRVAYIVTGAGPCRSRCLIYGTGIYTDDSDLSLAAVHAGLLQPGERRDLAIEFLPGQSGYLGTTRHDVTSQTYGNWRRSFRFLDDPTAAAIVAEQAEVDERAASSNLTGLWEGQAQCGDQSVPMSLSIGVVSAGVLPALARYYPHSALIDSFAEFAADIEIDAEGRLSAERSAARSRTQISRQRLRVGGFTAVPGSDGHSLSGNHRDGGCQEFEVVRVQHRLPSTVPLPEGGGRFDQSLTSSVRCRAILEWMESLTREFDRALFRVGSLEAVRAFALLYADDDFVPLFGRPFDDLGPDAAQDAWEPYVRRYCDSVSSERARLNALPAGNALRPMNNPCRSADDSQCGAAASSIGGMPLRVHIRQIRALRHRLASMLADPNPLNHELVALRDDIRATPWLLWPSEKTSALAAIEERLSASLQGVLASMSEALDLETDPDSALQRIAATRRELSGGSNQIETGMLTTFMADLDRRERALVEPLIIDALDRGRVLLPSLPSIEALDEIRRSLLDRLSMTSEQSRNAADRQMAELRARMMATILDETISGLEALPTGIDHMSDLHSVYLAFDAELQGAGLSSAQSDFRNAYMLLRSRRLIGALADLESGARGESMGAEEVIARFDPSDHGLPAFLVVELWLAREQAE